MDELIKILKIKDLELKSSLYNFLKIQGYIPSLKNIFLCVEDLFIKNKLSYDKSVK